MPRLVSLLSAYALWMLYEEHPDWAGEMEPIGLVGTLAVSWLFGMRWRLPREERPWEAGPQAYFLLPLVAYWCFLGPFGGLHLWQEWSLPGILSAWIGLVPFLIIQFSFRVGEAALLGLERADAQRFAWRQTIGLLLGVVPLAFVAQGWELGYLMLPDLPEDPALRSVAQRRWVYVVEVGTLLLVLPLVLILVPRMFGATRRSHSWQPVVNRMWQGTGPAPQVLEWPTEGLLANAMAVGFGPWRKVLISDRLENELYDHEVEAVLGHELGHLHNRHAPSLVAGTLGILILVAWTWSEADGAWWTGALLGLLAIAAVFFLVFRTAGRLFELEADLEVAARYPDLVAGLVGALTYLGCYAPRRGTRHPPVDRRVAELHACAADPARLQAWKSRAKWVRKGLWALFATSLVAGWFLA